MSEEKRRPEAGDTVRDGVRSIVGILGALKDAIEQEFEDLRGTGERGSDSAERRPDPAPTTASDAQPADSAMKDLRDRFDFVPRKEIEALRQEVVRLHARVDALEQASGVAPAAGPEPEADPAPIAPKPAEPPEPPIERPFRIDSD